MNCQARVITTPFTIGDKTFHNTGECGAKSFKRISVDDGDAEMHICSRCLVRFYTKANKDSKWLGWFDCDYPPTAPIHGSKLFWEAATEAYLEENPTAECKNLTPGFLNRWLAARKPLPPSEPSSDEESLLPQREEEEEEQPSLEQQIADLKAWLAGPGKKASLKEQVAKNKELYNLKLQLK